MTAKQLKELIKQGESRNVEFKQAASSARDLAREIVAFANTLGGTLLIGIDDSGKIIGVKDFKEAEQIITNTLSHNCRPSIQATISRIDVSGKTLAVVEIPEGTSKPYEANHVVYLRTGSSTRPASREEKQDMYASVIKEGYDLLPVKNATLDDFSRKEITRYMKLRNARLNTPVEPYSESLLRKLLAVIQVNGMFRPTVSGILLFGKEPQEFSETRLGYIRLARFKGKEVGTFIDQLDVYGTLTNQIDEALKFVERNIRFGWTTEKMPREKRYEYPLHVVKEAITNACAHRDYYQSGTILVSIFDDRIAVQSPGPLPQGVTVENLERECKRRNDNICQRLFEMGYIEAWGMGIDMMNREMRSAGLPQPMYEDTGASFIVTLIGPGEKWMAEKEVKLSEGLNERQKKAIEYIREKGRITNREYRELTSLGRVYVLKDLNDMVE
ncbi:MAG: RNA-binding domain-containing protein, partial [Thermodesulfobacteriota bacterium]